MQNTSHAVMAQRVESKDSLDFFPTPPWATRALIDHVLLPAGWLYSSLKRRTVLEPACGRGDMVRPLSELFEVDGRDIHDYGAGFAKEDFLRGWMATGGYDFVVTNPPFRLAYAFALEALRVASCGVALLVRTSFLEGKDRHLKLFEPCPPTIVAPFVERVPMFKGRLDQKGSTATSYCWLYWDKAPIDPYTRLVWIPPCRKQLERPGDYDSYDGLKDGHDSYLEALK